MSKMTVSKVKELLATIDNLTDPRLQELQADSRKGVQAALRQHQRQVERRKAARQAFQARFKYENQLWAQGCKYVAGMDEVGRGPLAGPVVTCAVILDPSFDLVGVTDSKQLTRHERENLYLRIVDEAVEVSIAVNDREVIDKMNIYAATQDAMMRAVNSLYHRPDHLIVDAVPLPFDYHQTTLIKGDQKSISVAAASIVAKEYRDHLMKDYDRVYPGYGFAENMGYGTKEHLAGLAKYGVTPIHRRSFNPVPKYL
ncbi:ribonuclease HII [Limosilactobacillus viscerum]|uniref:ribonuclease HII n=1 Tax=Limosilactobacillus viscerum TaxID=2993450 RepID=UPI0024BBB7F3|nr:ribonuclease HII [Limosilactobacillus viscerum]